MSFSREKRESIKRELVEMLNNDDADFDKKLMDKYEITITSIRRYLKDLSDSHIIRQTRLSNCGYELIWHEYEYTYDLWDMNIEEHSVYSKVLAPLISNCSESANRIWPYVFVEIMNNSIEHSNGTKIIVKIRKSYLYTDVIIADNGLGIFQRIIDYVKRENNIDIGIDDIIMELHKGKLTIAKFFHSGEGIFFVSKMLDYFAICSDNHVFFSGDTEDENLREYLKDYAAKISGCGTTVWMELSNFTERKMQDVFDAFSTAENGFAKTIIPIYDICSGGYPVARSLARRLTFRMEEFSEVTLDFAGVPMIGQGFAHEVFVVFKNKYPQTNLIVANANPDVSKMILHVTNTKYS